MPYCLLDSGNGRKLERFGSVTLVRPCAAAVWTPRLADSAWDDADAQFLRDPENRWVERRRLPASWLVEIGGVTFKLERTDFGHVGCFPEHACYWDWMATLLKQRCAEGRTPEVLNLFAYSGGATLAAAQAGAAVCHLDASQTTVTWARDNAIANGLVTRPIRWIVDDAVKFLKREARRGHLYDAVICDPPTFGRGRQGEVFKIERDILPLLDLCCQVLVPDALFLLLSCHTPGFTPITLSNLVTQAMGSEGYVDAGEMVLPAGEGVVAVPSGCYARWSQRRVS